MHISHSPLFEAFTIPSIVMCVLPQNFTVRVEARQSSKKPNEEANPEK